MVPSPFAPTQVLKVVFPQLVGAFQFEKVRTSVHDHSSHGIEYQGQRSRLELVLGLKLESKFEGRGR